MSFLAELRRRNVIRVAGLYLVTAWLLIQIAETLLPIFHTPDWVLQVLVVLLALGFIPALIVSWVFELTPQGLVRDDGDARTRPTATHRTQRMDRMLLIGFVAVAALVIVDRLWPEAPTMATADSTSEAASKLDSPSDTETNRVDPPVAPEVAAASIAVLPFDDLSPEGDQAYFSEGISEEILNVLVSADGLSVASRTSSFQFRTRQDIGIPDIARTLKVRHVLEGSVRKAGDRIRITAQLIDGETDVHLWSETFDRTLSTENLFEIQDEIASAIVAAISNNLDVRIGAIAAPAKRTDSVDAYALYLQARTRYFARVEFNRIADLLEQALVLDPGFTDALAMRGAVYVMAPEYGVFLLDTPTESRAYGRELARAALALDSGHALALGVVSLSQDFDAFSGSGLGDITHAQLMAGYNRALDAQPNNVDLINWRGYMRLRTGHVAGAAEDFLRCRDLEPAYAPCRGNLAGAWVLLGELSKARAHVLESAAQGAVLPSVATLLTLRALDMREAFYLVGSRLSGLRGWHAFDELYDALGDPQADHSVLRARLQNLGQAQGSDNQQVQSILVALGDHRHAIANWIVWLPAYARFRQSETFKNYIINSGTLQSWQADGFPPQCRSVGDDDFSCD